MNYIRTKNIALPGHSTVTKKKCKKYKKTNIGIFLHYLNEMLTSQDARKKNMIFFDSFWWNYSKECKLTQHKHKQMQIKRETSLHLSFEIKHLTLSVTRRERKGRTLLTC